MFEDNVLESSPHALEDVESPPSVPVEDRAPNAKPSSQEVDKKPRTGLLKRRPVVYAIGAMLLAAAVGGGHVYLDYAERFQSTDDAFIAARQSELAPKTSGYITAVPAATTSPVTVGH